jgi:hypothetical protein
MGQITLKLNVTDLRNELTELNPCAGGLGKVLRPPVGGLGGTSPRSVFPRNNYVLLKSVPFLLSSSVSAECQKLQPSILTWQTRWQLAHIPKSKKPDRN